MPRRKADCAQTIACPSHAGSREFLNLGSRLCGCHRCAFCKIAIMVAACFHPLEQPYACVVRFVPRIITNAIVANNVARGSNRPPLQLRVLGLSFLVDWNVGIGVFQEGKKDSVCGEGAAGSIGVCAR